VAAPVATLNAAVTFYNVNSLRVEVAQFTASAKTLKFSQHLK